MLLFQHVFILKCIMAVMIFKFYLVLEIGRYIPQLCQFLEIVLLKLLLLQLDYGCSKKFFIVGARSA
jgi:hypothetical protein